MLNKSTLSKISILISCLCISLSSLADPLNCQKDSLQTTALSDSEQFHQFFYSAMNSLKIPAGLSKNLELRHYVADEIIEKILSSENLTQALSLSKQTSIAQLSQKTVNTNQKLTDLDSSVINKLSAVETLRARPITLVIVPGIFGEFIPNRPFEEILSLPSSFKNDFARTIQTAIAQKNPNAFDQSLDLEAFQYKNVSLDQVIHVASIDDQDGKPLVKIVLLFTPFASLETLGDVSVRAKYFNQRLQKYVNLTGPQDLVLVGYSRGVTFALDMVSQAKDNSQLNYIQSVRGVVSYAGVVFGSSLTNNLMDPTSSDAKSAQAVIELTKQLQQIPEELSSATGYFGLPSPTALLKKQQLVHQNNMAWLATIQKIIQAQPKSPGFDLSNFDISKFDISQITNPGLNASQIKFDLDPRGMFSIAFKALGNVGVFSAISDYNKNIQRFKWLVPEMLTGVNQLREDYRAQWWKTHTIPSNITYYSLPAVMADPQHSAIEKQIYEANVGYNNSYDDRSLIDNQRKYVTLSGLNMNDSQVSMAQSTFIPKIISQMNPQQTPIQTKFLGVLGSHHWGITLQVVNKTFDNKVNPFPRKAALLGLAAKISSDLQAPHACQ